MQDCVPDAAEGAPDQESLSAGIRAGQQVPLVQALVQGPRGDGKRVVLVVGQALDLGEGALRVEVEVLDVEPADTRSLRPPRGPRDRVSVPAGAPTGTFGAAPLGIG